MTLRRFGVLTARLRESLKREDRRAGELIAMFYNAHRDTQKDPQGIGWTDVFPEWKEAPAEQSEDEMYEAMKLWVGSNLEQQTA